MNISSWISRRRAELMGVAAVMVLLFHMPDFTGNAVWRFLARERGNMGVDVFILLSGFGLTYSLKARPDLGRYFTRRLERLLPAYYLMFALVILIDGMPAWDSFVAHILPIHLWVGQEDLWFISACLLYYLLIPPMYFLMLRARMPRLMFAVLMGVFCVIIPAATRHCGPEAAIMRLPALVVGVGIGTFAQRHESRRDWLIDGAMLVALYIAGLVLASHSHALSRAPLNLMKSAQTRRMCKALRTPLIVAALALILEGVQRTPLRFVNAALRALGRCSLEVYLGSDVIRYANAHWLHLEGAAMAAFMVVMAYPVAMAMSWMSKQILKAVKSLPIFISEPQPEAQLSQSDRKAA